MIAGFVHGDKVDGHFFDSVSNFYQAQIHDERNRANQLLAEAAGHITDEAIAAKYLEQAAGRPFCHATASIRSGPLLSMGRGRLAQTFLDHTDEEWMFCSDTDMTWVPDLPQEMIRIAQAGANLPDGTNSPIRILAAPAWIIWTAQDGSIDKRVSNVYSAVRDDQGQDWLSQMTEDDLKEPGFYQVGACGGALMLVHREALINVRDNICGGQPFWYHHLPTPPILKTPEGLEIHDQYGEDTSFCVRAREAGEQIWVHSGIKIGHAKTIVQY